MNDDHDISKPSDNFAYKDEKEKSDLQDQMYSTKMQLEFKLQLFILLLWLLLASTLLYLYITS